MRLNKWLISLLWVLFSIALFSADAGFIKLEKAAVSSVPDDLLLPELGSVTLDAKGNVFALAGHAGRGGDCFIVKFDPALRYVTKFGRDGKGPGEFSTSFAGIDNRLSIDSAGNVHILDNTPQRMVVYDNDGKYIEDVQIARYYLKLFGSLWRIHALGNKTYICIRMKDVTHYSAVLFKTDPIKIIIEYPYSVKAVRIGTDFFIETYYGANCLLDTDENYFILAESNVFKFRLYDKQGNLKLEVYEKNRVFERFSSKEMKMIRESFLPKDDKAKRKTNFLDYLRGKGANFSSFMDDIEKSKNVIADVRLAGDRIFVFTIPADVTIKDRYPVEIYDLKGKMLKQTCFKKIPLKIWKNYVFYFEWDKEDNPFIVKYKMLDIP